MEGVPQEGWRSYHRRVQSIVFFILVVSVCVALQTGLNERWWRNARFAMGYGVISGIVRTVPLALAHMKVRLVNDKKRALAEWSLIFAASLLLAYLFELLFISSEYQRNGGLLLTFVAALVWLSVFIHKPPYIGRIRTALLLTGRIALLVYIPILTNGYTIQDWDWTLSFFLSIDEIFVWIFPFLFGFFLIVPPKKQAEETAFLPGV